MMIFDLAALAPLTWGAAYLVVVLVLTRGPRPRSAAPAEATDERFPTAA